MRTVNKVTTFISALAHAGAVKNLVICRVLITTCKQNELNNTNINKYC